MSVQPIPREGLRERHKRRRRDAILRAVRELLREGGRSALTKERIAERAEVAPATVYNLLGTRERLWEALADDFMDELEQRLAARPASDPIARARQVVRATVELLVADRVVGAHMLRGWEESGLLLKRGPAGHIVAALERAQAEGVLLRTVDPTLLAGSVATACIGAMHQWAAGVLGDEKLLARALLALDVAMAAAASPAHRAAMLRPLKRRRSR